MNILSCTFMFQDLLLYLLQLVQALKYEDFEEIKSGLNTMATRDTSVSVVNEQELEQQDTKQR